MKSWCKEFAERQGMQIEFKSAEVPTSYRPEIGLCLFRVYRRLFTMRQAQRGETD